MQELIVSSLTALEADFQKNELAFLALTTKIEMPLRDRWAYTLFRKLEGKYSVSREWKRTDLAILDEQKPLALIELKAMYSFDAALDIDGIGGFTDAMAEDADKARKLAVDDTEIYTVLLATHPDSTFLLGLDGVVKYVSGINKAIKKFDTSQKVEEVAVEAVNKDLCSKNVVASGSLNGGQAYGSQVSVLFWVVKE